MIEDGSLVKGATSFVTVDEVRAFAEARASTLPAAGSPGDDAIQAACIRAADYLESFREEFKGVKVSPGVQALQWPRKGVSFEGYDVPETEIPFILKNAQCELAIEAANGVDLMPTGDGRKVIKKKVDVLETTYSEGVDSGTSPTFARVRALLLPLLKTAGSGSSFQIVRA